MDEPPIQNITWHCHRLPQNNFIKCKESSSDSLQINIFLLKSICVFHMVVFGK